MLTSLCFSPILALQGSDVPEYLRKEKFDLELTKDADKMICIIYKSFLQERKSGRSKAEARRFNKDELKTFPDFKSWHPQDITDVLLEIGRKDLVKIYIGGTFELSDSGIIYMENRFKNGFLEVADFVSKFLP